MRATWIYDLHLLSHGQHGPKPNLPYAGLPLHGVLHAGGVLVDGTLATQTLAGMRVVRSENTHRRCQMAQALHDGVLLGAAEETRVYLFLTMGTYE